MIMIENDSAARQASASNFEPCILLGYMLEFTFNQFAKQKKDFNQIVMYILWDVSTFIGKTLDATL